MQIIIPNFTNNPADFLRSCGYAFDKSENEEMAFMRRLAGTAYPRFHIYCHIEKGQGSNVKGQMLVINLHLDQKKASYKGTSAHSGEYSGELIEEEIRRIEKLSKSLPSSTPKKLEPW